MKIITKGQKVSLQSELDTTALQIAFQWKNVTAKGPEIDSSMMLLSETGKLEDEANFIFYNQPVSKNGDVSINKQPKINYQKSINIDLAKTANDITKIVFILTIDESESNIYQFSALKDIFIDIFEISGQKLLLQYKIEDLSKETAVIAIEIYKYKNEWKLQAVGNGFNAGLAAILKQYGSEKIQVSEESNSNKANTVNSSKGSVPLVNPITTPGYPSDLINPVPDKSAEIKSEVVQDMIKPEPFTPEPVKQEVVKRELSGDDSFKNKYRERFNIIKNNFAEKSLSGKRLKVLLVMDLSYSMKNLFKNGVVQDSFARVLPIALQNDQNDVIDVWLFHNEAFNHKIPFAADNHEDYVNREIFGSYDWGGTNYSPVIEMINNKYPSAGKTTEPVLVLFFADGSCADKKKATEVIVQSSENGVYWQFIALGDISYGFEFLDKPEQLENRKINNAGFIYLKDLKNIDEQQLYKEITDNFSGWVQEAASLKIIN